MNSTEISEIIISLFKQKEIMKDISVDDDFFDLGVSSLTVVELQIVIEKALGKSVSTSLLMVSPTISEWISVYTEKMQQDSLESNNT